MPSPLPPTPTSVGLRAGIGCWVCKIAGERICPPSPAACVQGVDEGGLSKELLQLLFRQCCAVHFGMFIELESRLLW